MVSEVLLHVNCVPKVEDNTRHVLKILLSNALYFKLGSYHAFI